MVRRFRASREGQGVAKASELPALSLRVVATLNDDDEVSERPIVALCDAQGREVGQISFMNEVSWDIIGDSWLFDITITTVGTVVTSGGKKNGR